MKASMNEEIEYIKQSKDLNLPEWGPYSKHYTGISKILNDQQKSMVDFVLCPGYIRGKVIIPDVNFDSSCHCWNAEPDLSYMNYRYELQWKDVEYADIEYFECSGGRLAKITFVNNTDFDKEYVCTVFSVFRTGSHAEMNLQDGEQWIGGEAYQTLFYGKPDVEWIQGDHYESQCSKNRLSMGSDGLRRGIAIQEYLVNNMGLGNQLVSYSNSFTKAADNRAFLMNKGTKICFEIKDQSEKYKNIYLRYCMYDVKKLVLKVKGSGFNEEVILTENTSGTLSGFNDLRFVSIPVQEAFQSGKLELEVVDVDFSGEDKAFILDGILLSNEFDEIKLYDRFVYFEGTPEFKIIRKESEKGLGLKSNLLKDLNVFLYSEDERPIPPHPYSDCTVTNIYNFDLSGSSVLRKIQNDSLTNWYKQNCIITGDKTNHFAGYNLAPIVCKAKSKREIYLAMVCENNGDQGYDECVKRAKDIYEQRFEIEKTVSEIQKKQTWKYEDTPFRFSQEKLKAMLFTNITYPVFIEDNVYKTYTPGKRWGGLFTWDSGMHGIGLNEYSPEKAAEIVNQYMINEEKADVDLVLHGSPLPLHIYLLNEIYVKTHDKELLAFFYPRAKRYYEYLAGKSKNSTYNMFGSGLLNPFEDGYNAYGVDDYAPQHYTGTLGQYGNVSPVSNTAHVIRAGKLMILFAKELGLEKDIAEYDEWNSYLEKGLQKYSWDEATGYFSYVFNDTKEKLYYNQNKTINFNMGLDGVSPLVAGICDETQKKALMGHIMTEGEMWTPYGITTVAMNAPYSRYDGYWNGKVWIPHQWFIWKAMISAGELDAAEKIACTTLKTWKNATEETYNTYEQFDATTGMGEGCHQFAGLSGPIAAFYNTYYKKGNVTVGYDAILSQPSYCADKNCLEFTFSTPFYKGITGVIAVMSKQGKYCIKVNDRTTVVETIGGWLNLSINTQGEQISVKIAEC